MTSKTITVVGGTGFLGRYVVRRLAKAGYRIRVIARRTDDAKLVKPYGDVGQIAIIPGDITQPATIEGKLGGSFAVVNLTGILYESGKQTFTAVHAQGAERLAQMAKTAGVERFIQISALGVDKASGSQYARSKSLGEKAVLAAFPDATILRPSVIFGPEDNFINQFACMGSVLPFLPLIGGGENRFQPVYVDDVAKAIEQCLTREEVKGEIFELGGPETYSFKDILDYIGTVTGKKRALLTLPYGIASAIGACNEVLPFPPLITRDQVKLLKHDNVVSQGAKQFSDLGITPVAMDAIVPQYLARFRKGAKAA